MPKLIKKGNTILFQDENDPTLERQRHNSEFDFTYYKSNVMIRLDGATLYNSSIASLLILLETSNSLVLGCTQPLGVGIASF